MSSLSKQTPIIVIFNGKARRFQERIRVDEALARLEADGYRIVAEAPGSADEASATAAGAPEEAVVVAAGGDGTVHAVANGLLDRAISDPAKADANDPADPPGPAFGVIPMGTANDFAKSLALGPDAAEAVTELVNGSLRQLDAVRVSVDEQPLWMVNAAAGGNAAEVNRRVDDEMKRRWGPWCYVRGVVDLLNDLRSYHVRLHIDDEPVSEFDAFNVLVANGRAVGGVEAAGRADPEDGRLEVVVVQEAPLLQTAEVAVDFFSGDYLESEQVVYRRAAHLKIECDRSIGFSVDGELCSGRIFEFETFPGVLAARVGSGYRH